MGSSAQPGRVRTPEQVSVQGCLHSVDCPDIRDADLCFMEGGRLITEEQGVEFALQVYPLWLGTPQTLSALTNRGSL